MKRKKKLMICLSFCSSLQINWSKSQNSFISDSRVISRGNGSDLRYNRPESRIKCRVFRRPIGTKGMLCVRSLSAILGYLSAENNEKSEKPKDSSLKKRGHYLFWRENLVGASSERIPSTYWSVWRVRSLPTHWVESRQSLETLRSFHTKTKN